MDIKKKISMTQALKEYFENQAVGYKCNLCNEALFTITGISKHWRQKHQHDTKIYIDL